MNTQVSSIFSNLRERRKYTDKVFWVIFIFLAVISAISMFSASGQLINKADGHILAPIIGHIGALLCGMILAYFIQFLPSMVIRMIGYVGLLFSIVCLLLTFTSLGVEINGEKRWIRLGFVFQPSELVKINLVIVVSDLLSRIKDAESRKRYFWITLALTAGVCGIILISNLSTALLIGIVIFLLMILARIPFKWLAAIIAPVVVVLIGGYFYVENAYIKQDKHMTGVLHRAETWAKRVDTAFGIGEQPAKTTTFEITQSNLAQVAVARGGQTPFGVLPGNSWARNQLPQAYSDFIFAIIVEEWGIAGAVLLIVLYLAILFRACMASSRYNDYAAMLMMMGLALMMTVQAFISMEVSVGLGPVTGQTLPLISDGKTSILMFSIYFGIMMAVSREQKELQMQQQATTRESKETVPDLEIENATFTKEVQDNRYRN